jgi:hypothetical protein
MITNFDFVLQSTKLLDIFALTNLTLKIKNYGL